jgi:uncharacterized membrane protein YphA (DoxX/SURF4 family)
MWNTVAWILQGVLALIFLFHGILYVFEPGPLVRSMREQRKWPPAIRPWFRIFIGVAELLAVVRLLLPGLLHLLTFLTPLAAAGLTIVNSALAGGRALTSAPMARLRLHASLDGFGDHL